MFFINIVNSGDFFYTFDTKKIENAIYRNILLLSFRLLLLEWLRREIQSENVSKLNIQSYMYINCH